MSMRRVISSGGSKKAVEESIMKSGVARHYGGFEQAVDKWIQFTD